jgi:pantoate--beta-alanine ligase
MLIATRIHEVRAAIKAHRQHGRRVAFVPTMGFLHDGHLDLVDAAQQSAEIVVMSIFVNPLQFGPSEDFSRYPRDVERDRAMAESHGVDLLFLPGVDEMYGSGSDVRITAGPIGTRWEGAVRPGHFDGVLTVVAKLFHIVRPDVACFGQKDVQQVTIIRRMVAELNFPIDLMVVPTRREPDGLAMSSRNVYLSDGDRRNALSIPRSLQAALAAWRNGERSGSALRSLVGRTLGENGGPTADYIAVVDPDHLEEVRDAIEGTVIAVAARIGPTRLIDNIVLTEQDR